MTKHKLTLLTNERRKRALNVSAEIRSIGIDKAFHWAQRASDWESWATRACAFLDDVWIKKSAEGLEALDVLMTHYRSAYRRHTARFLETRAFTHAEMGNRVAAEVLLMHAQAVALGRNLDGGGDFADGFLDAVGRCPGCAVHLGMKSWIGKAEVVHPGDRPRHGRALYRCPKCGLETAGRHLKGI